MGVVYRARDTKLDRLVAIKILPESLALDLERLARFAREARVLASLNHPHIAAIYGLEERDGVHALVLELVEGETLAERLQRGRVPMPEALTIARQIADALEATHEKGIVHRDLKPANIKITPPGVVKVLDFGLAKAESGVAEPKHSQSPTITVAGMHERVLLGTASYMSPEQARGQAVDKWADIWAFGCVLYEMLTGQRAFDGAEVTDVLARILERDVDLSSLPPETAVIVRGVIRQCLQKDPRQRLRDIGDARLLLEGGFDIAVDAISAAASTRDWKHKRVAWLVAVLVALAAAAGFAVPYFRTASPAPEMRVEINTPPTSDPMSFAISPDGRRLVFVATHQEQPHLWLRPLDAVTAEPLVGTQGASRPFWSPNSRSVAFFAGGKLKRFDLGSGLPRTLADVPVGLGGTWSPDGVILFAGSGGPLFRVAASGGEQSQVTTIDPSRHFSH
jgi:serine/threonine protein kinase